MKETRVSNIAAAARAGLCLLEVVVDEAHRLKNSKSKSLQMIKSLQADFMLLLTGTPIQNNIDELYTMLNLLDDYKVYFFVFA